MPIASAIASIKGAVELLAKVREIADSTKHAELKAVVAELANKLADARMEVAGLKEELADLRDENKALLDRARGEKPVLKWGCYVFDGDEERLYCTACFDSKGKRSLTHRRSALARQCPVCRVEIRG